MVSAVLLVKSCRIKTALVFRGSAWDVSVRSQEPEGPGIGGDVMPVCPEGLNPEAERRAGVLAGKWRAAWTLLTLRKPGWLCELGPPPLHPCSSA